MKKLYTILIAILLCLFPSLVLAKGNITVSSNSLNIIKGSSASFTINASNAAGRVDISVQNSNISVSSSSLWVENESVTITVNGSKTGSSQVYVKLSDAATFDEEELSGTYTINVNVKNPETPKEPQTPVTPTPDPTPAKSSNTKLFSLEVEGYSPVKVDDTHFTLTVPNNASKVNVKVKAEDAKAKVSGDGEKTLELGDNEVKIVVTAENGNTKTYNLKITRKKTLAYEDLAAALKDPNLVDINVTLTSPIKLSKEDMKAIKDSKKIVNFEIVDAKEKPLYVWIINGQVLTNENEFDTKVTFGTDNSESIGKVTNYANGINITFAHQGELPSGVRFKVYVGDIYTQDDTSLHIYNFNKDSNEMSTFMDKVLVNDGYVEYDVTNTKEQFLTRSTISGAKNEVSPGVLQIVIIAVAIIEFIAIVVLFIYYFAVIKQKIKDTEYVYGDGQL